MKLKKNLIAVLAAFVLSPTFAELPKIGNTSESISNAFQELIFNVINPFENVDWHDGSRMLQAYSYQLENLTYDKVRDYVSEIETAMKKLEASGTLSKGNLENFKDEMEHAYCNLSGVQVPDSVSLNYNNDPNIKILEQNEQAYKKRIADCQKMLDEMQTPEEIQKMIDDNKKRLDELNSAKKRDAKQIKAVEDHSMQLGIAYGQAISNKKKLQATIDSDTNSLNAISAQTEQYKISIKDEYKQELSEKVRAFSTWKDFFDGKNTVIKDFLELLDTRKKAQTDFTNFVPMKDAEIYQQKLDAFISGWGL